MKRVLVLGGGFGGVYAALELEKRLGRAGDVEITLVNRDNFFLFTPMLHEVAASDLDLTDIVSPIRRILKRASFFEGVVERVDLPGRRVVVSHGEDRHEHELPYDYLVIALGSITNFYGLPGLEDRALTMKSLSDAIHLRNRLIAQLEEADTHCAQDDRGALMTFVVAGGGFAGVETIAGINDFVRDSLRFYPRIPETVVRMVLVHAGPIILPELGDRLGAYAQRKLTERGVEIHTDVRVERVEDDLVTLSNGMAVPARTIIWTAGTSPHPLVGSLPCRRDRGKICVNEFLEVEGWPGVWALGDCALVPNRKGGGFHPPTAQHALREGKVVARNVAAAIRSQSRVAFDFGGLGQLAAIGHRTGVAKILGFTFSGFFAWWLWRTIYLSKLPRLEKKVRVALSWTLDLFFRKDFVQYLTPQGTEGRADRPGAPPVTPDVVGLPGGRDSRNALATTAVETSV
ncbi:MAG TPA: NAD(P)/FAD-dependent oxidoreductase [Vicinamibacterales bacterium]|nr:NAD(P)/FAD-dependent oxidoreductase [Vicinamibacterales bacterium]